MLPVAAMEGVVVVVVVGDWGKKLHIPHSQKPHRAQPAPSQVPYIHMPTWRPADEDRDEDFCEVVIFEGILGEDKKGN